MSESTIKTFLEKTGESIRQGTFARLILAVPDAATGAITKYTGRMVELRGVAHLSLTVRALDRETTRNISESEIIPWLEGTLDPAGPNALLNTTSGDWQLLPGKDGASRLVRHKAAFPTPPPRSHDEPKAALLDTTAADWLQGLEVLDAAGKLRASMADKHRQINHYLEIFSHLARDCGWTEATQGELTLADMGCGKGYLTFGLWHLFTRVWKLPVRILGVEARLELAAKTNALAKRIGATNLQFLQGEIESATLPKLDGLIALHACNTATDDAILRGISAEAKLILVAPCCHRELRPQLSRPEPLAPVLRHGLMEERMAEWLTDGLRALFLEWAGYKTKIFEFVSSEHTPKNLMISAVRTGEAFKDETARARILELKQFFGIELHRLDGLLGSTPAH